MYIVDKTLNRIQQLEKKSFSNLGFRERDHLQEWLANNPVALGEELLIIQKEFDGFDDTNERLDLLALDKNGNIVVIENKLDDTGRDVTWQALKYASYCSTLKKSQIIEIYQKYLDRYESGSLASEKLNEFFTEQNFENISLNIQRTQRIILVAGNFRKEVTSTVLWLRDAKIRIQCFKATAYALGEQVFLSLEQFIPIVGAEEYTIGIAEKSQEEAQNNEELKKRHHFRMEFWQQLIPKMKGKSKYFQNTSPVKDHWISSGGTGISAVQFVFVITRDYAAVELSILKPDTQANKRVFDEIYLYKEEVEKIYGKPLEWERLNDKKMCRVTYRKQGVNIFEKEDWPAMQDFLVEDMIKFEKALTEPLQKVRKKLNERTEDILIEE